MNVGAKCIESRRDNGSHGVAVLPTRFYCVFERLVLALKIIMQRSEFIRRMEEAIKQSLTYANLSDVVNLDSCGFLLYPNQSNDVLPPKGDQEVHLEESLPRGQYHGPLDFEATLSFLWRDGKVPEWINVGVCRRISPTFSLQFQLVCCARFSAHNGATLGEIQPFVAIGYFHPASQWGQT